MTIDKLPNIRTVCLAMAAGNGMLHRWADQDALLDAAMSALAADGAPTADVLALEEWIGHLTEAALFTLTDGEETEMRALQAKSPRSETGDYQPVAFLLDDAYRAMAEVWP